MPVVRDDLSPLALVNKMGAPHRVFPTFMTFPQSFAFRDRGPGMVWDARTKIHTEPLVDKRELAMGFCTGTTAALGLSEGQRRFVLGQAMDLYTMVWIVDLCPTLQPHHGDQLLSRRQRIMVRGHSGPHPWRKELRPWLEKPNESFDSSNR